MPSRVMGHGVFLPESERRVLDVSYHKREDNPVLKSVETLEQPYTTASLPISQYKASYSSAIPSDYLISHISRPVGRLEGGTAEFPEFKTVWQTEYQATMQQHPKANGTTQSKYGKESCRAKIVTTNSGQSAYKEDYSKEEALEKTNIR